VNFERPPFYFCLTLLVAALFLSPSSLQGQTKESKAGLPAARMKVSTIHKPQTVKQATAKQETESKISSNSTVNSLHKETPIDNPKSPDVVTPSVEERLKAMEQVIEQQQREIQALRELVIKNAGANTYAQLPETPRLVANQSQVGAVPSQPPVTTASNQPLASSATTENAPTAQQKKFDELYKRFGTLRLSGDIRFRAETFSNQGFDSFLEPPNRNRLRIRARLGIDGTINKYFDWGIRLASGTPTDQISSNQTFTDFYERKPFALDRAFVRYDSKSNSVGVQLVGGKFEPTFRRTQLVWDDDLNVEGASEALYFKTTSSLKQIKLVAFQLPFSEVSNGKDGALYGGQLQTDWQMGATFSANVNVAYYDWVRADLVLRGLGASTTQVNGGITNGAGVTGGQNGIIGTTNRIIKDSNGNPIGFLANFNLFDVLGNLTWQATPRLPVTFSFDYVRNLTSRISNEKNGYWTGVQLGQAKEEGDWLIGYAFARIEQDAVLVPFNFSDILASNSRAHMPNIAYQIANGVTLQWTGLFYQRANQIVPLSPVNRWTNRMQFDVIYKF
jgi:hypothetical protein